MEKSAREEAEARSARLEEARAQSDEKFAEIMAKISELEAAKVEAERIIAELMEEKDEAARNRDTEEVARLEAERLV